MSDLRCDHVVEMVTDFLDGALDEAAERRLIEHLSGCDGCQRYVEQFRRTVQALHEPASGGLSPEARQRLLEEFRRPA